ncbi:MAG: DMT family transporter [Patescibacteria group bacterium]
MKTIPRQFKFKKTVVLVFAAVLLSSVAFSVLPGLALNFQTADPLEKTLAVLQVTPVSAAGEQTESKDNDTDSFFVTAVGWVVEKAVTLEGFVITTETKILIFFLKYNGFVKAKAVVIGWTLVRDVSNLFFVLVLLVIALATILRIEAYNFKRLLPKILLMAVLINFSRLICGFIIDFAQVIMMSFVAAFVKIGTGGNLYAVLHINDILYSTYDVQTKANTEQGISPTAIVVSGILAVFLLLVACIVIFTMMTVIIMRMIMLWMLVVLSPLPYILSAIPKAERYAQQWWQEFSKYVIVGPILAFFLWLTFAVASTDREGSIGGEQIGLGATGLDSLKTSLETTDKDTSGQTNQPITEEDNNGIFTGIGQVENMLSLIIGIGMLMAGLMITQQLGVAGGQMGGAAMSKMKSLGTSSLRSVGGLIGTGAKTLGKAPFQYIGRKVNEAVYDDRLPAWVNPAAMYRGWVARREALYTKAKEGAALGGQEMFEKAFTGVAQPRRLQMKIADSQKYASEYLFLPKEKLANYAANLYKQYQTHKTPEMRAKLRGVAQTAFRNGFEDDVMDQEIFRNMAPIDPRTNMPLHLEKEHYEKVWHNILGDHEAGAYTAATGDEIAHATKHFGVAGLTQANNVTGDIAWNDYDEKTGRFEWEEIGPDGRSYLKKDANKEIKRAKEGGRVELAEAIKEVGRNRSSFHYQGITGVQDRKDAKGEKMRIAAPFSELTMDMLNLQFKGQREIFLGEHFNSRTAIALAGGKIGDSTCEFEDNGLTQVLAGGEYAPHLLRNIALLDAIEPWLAVGMIKKVGGSETAKPESIKYRTGDWVMPLLSLRIARDSGLLEKIHKETDQTKKEQMEQDMFKQYATYSPRAAQAAGAPGPQPSPTPGPTPGALGPQPSPTAGPSPVPYSRMAQDFDREKFVRTNQAVHRYDNANDFYKSDEYKNDQNKYESAVEYARHRDALNQKELDRVRGTKTASTTKAGALQAGAGINFSDPELQKAYGVNSAMDAAYFEGENKDKVIEMLAAQYSHDLEAQGMAVEKINEQVEKFKQGLRNAKTLRLHNNASLTSRLDQALHEKAHAQTMGLADEQLNQFWQSLSTDQQQQIETDIKSKYGNNIASKQMKQEAIAEMAGVGKGIYAPSDKTKEVLTGLNVKTRPQAQEDISKLAPVAQKDVEKEGEELKKAVAGFDDTAIVQALAGIEGILANVASTLDKMPKSPVESGVKADLNRLLGQVRDHQSGAGGVLDPGSVSGLLASINTNLKSINEQSKKEKPSGTGEGKIPPMPPKLNRK